MIARRQPGAGHRSKGLLRLLLIVCTWQGPLPCVHRHAAAADGAQGVSAEDSTWLVEHLRTWHPDGEACSEECLHWHLHLQYPPPSEGEKPGPRPAEDRLSTAATTNAELLSPERGLSARFPLSASELHGREVVPARLPGRAIGAHFYDGFAPTLPLPLRFCVARC